MGQGPTTRLRRQIERHLGGEKLADFVSRRRSDGTGWRPLATEITERTGVEVSHEALRLWFADSDPAEVSS